MIPLDSLLLPYTEDGVTKEIPALSKKWVVKRCYVPFCSPPLKEGASYVLGAKESWLERTRFFCKDMKWLLQLQHHQFWSQVVYDSSTMAAIVSFLQEAPPFYLLSEVFSDEEMWVAYEEAHCLVLLVIKRLATSKESETSFMSPKLHADLIYDYYLLTVPVLVDLCALCWPSNRALLQGLFNDIFMLQPKYLHDLSKAITCISQVLDSVSQCLGLSAAPPTNGEVPPERLNERLSVHQGPLTLALLQDLVVHVLDSACTLSILTEVCTEACTAFHEQSFETRLVWFYENVIPELFSRMEALLNVDEEPVLFVGLKTKLDMARIELLKTFRHIIFSFINSAFESKEQQEVMRSVDNYVNVLTECLVEKLFMRDYHQMYNVGHDLDVLAQISPEMDSTKRTYILEAVIDCLEVPELPPSPTFGLNRPPAFSAHNSAKAGPSNAHTSKETREDGVGAEKVKVSGIKLESLITQVQDVMPHLGEGFIERCLEHYEYKSEDVINAVLEERLPPELDAIDREFPRDVPTEEETLAQRVDTNIDSDDESKEPVYVEAHKGKRNDMYRDVLMLINDKSHREVCRDFYTTMGLYEDEYDDTYDAHLDVSVGDDTDDPERFRREQKGAGSRKPVAASPEGSSEEDSSEDEGAPSGDHFVANPEKLRAQQEQRRQARAARRGGHHTPHSSGDVVGKPKGQGQDKSTVVSRNHKNTNKSARANHNRRSAAQWKRRQGMVPS